MKSIYPIMNIYLNRVLDNYRLLQSMLPSVQIAAVVKDNAYGLGAKEVAKALSNDCHTFFVAYASEGAVVRSVSPKSDIYILQGIAEDDLEIVKKNHLIPVLSSLESWRWWQGQAISDIKPAIQVDTGFNRLGFQEQEILRLSPNERDNASLFLSHLACADTPSHPLNRAQLKKFMKLHEFFPKTPTSLAASGGLLLGKNYWQDIMRIGALMYGIALPKDMKEKLQHTVHISATVLQTAHLKKGETVSYGASYTADSDKKIATISIGYGDGLPRALSNQIGRFFYQGQSLPILGKVCMDCTICDVTHIPDLPVGASVEILNDTYNVDDMALDAGTIGYEILSRFGKNSRFLKTYHEHFIDRTFTNI